MALTQSAWTTTTVDGQFVSTCTVIATAAENDAYTLKTPTTLDPRLPWKLYYKAIEAGDAQALPLEIYIGYSSSFAISGDGATIGATDGVLFKQIYDDVRVAVAPIAFSFHMDPDSVVAEVVTTASVPGKIHVPVAPYYAFNLNGGSTLVATTHTFTIIQ